MEWGWVWSYLVINLESIILIDLLIVRKLLEPLKFLKNKINTTAYNIIGLPEQSETQL